MAQVQSADSGQVVDQGQPLIQLILLMNTQGKFFRRLNHLDQALQPRWPTSLFRQSAA